MQRFRRTAPRRWSRVTTCRRTGAAPSRSSTSRVADRRPRRDAARGESGELPADGRPRSRLPLWSRAPWEWTFDDVLALMAQRCGVSPDPLYDSGADTIDAALTVERLEAMAAHLRTAASVKARVLVATGHPTGVLVVHLEIARALASAGCTLLTPPAVWEHVDYAGRLTSAMFGDARSQRGEPGGQPAAHPFANSDGVDAARPGDEGQAAPDLVVADHGFAGAAGRAGVRCVGFADCNDPALFVGEAEGDVAVCVPLDDNVMPESLRAIDELLLATASASGPPPRSSAWLRANSRPQPEVWGFRHRALPNPRLTLHRGRLGRLGGPALPHWPQHRYPRSRTCVIVCRWGSRHPSRAESSVRHGCS